MRIFQAAATGFLLTFDKFGWRSSHRLDHCGPTLGGGIEGSALARRSWFAACSSMRKRAGIPNCRVEQNSHVGLSLDPPRVSYDAVLVL